MSAPFDEAPSHGGVLLWEGRPRPEFRTDAILTASGRGRPAHNVSPCCRGLCEEQHLTVKEPFLSSIKGAIVADKKYTVLVLCTGNSCRSQMAEVLLNHDLAGRVRALSAGTRPQPRVADGAIAALKAAGLNTEGLHPKDIDAVMNEDIDLVVTVCDNAKEACPIFPKPIPAIHLPFHDPHGEPLESFLAVRDDIRARLVAAVREALQH